MPRSNEPRSHHAPAKTPIEVSSTSVPQTFAEAESFLNDRVDVERMRPSQIGKDTFRLDRMQALMDALGRPDREMKLVHIAGSKGKGSTCEMTAAALAGCGYAVGVYTSPHLVTLRERIRLGDRMIDESEFVDALARVSRSLGPIERKHGPATFFEILTAAALVHFAAQAVDVAVIEVGLGGRLDSTNVISPEVTAVTAIQLEHTQILGDTLAKIAREKAGIFKRGIPAVTISQKPEILDVFRKVAADTGCTLHIVGETLEFTSRFESSADRGPHYKVCLYTPTAAFEHVHVPLVGEHQAQNCGVALACLDALRQRGLDLPDRGIMTGLARTPDTGRLELIHPKPRIIADGAHTTDSIGALMKSVGQRYKYDNLIVVFGCAADKDVSGMLAKLASGADKLIFTKASDNARAADPRDLQRKLTDKPSQTSPTVKDAINLAAKAAQRDDLILVTGSFYVAGEAKKLFAERTGST